MIINIKLVIHVIKMYKAISYKIVQNEIKKYKNVLHVLHKYQFQIGC